MCSPIAQAYASAAVTQPVYAVCAYMHTCVPRSACTCGVCVCARSRAWQTGREARRLDLVRFHVACMVHIGWCTLRGARCVVHAFTGLKLLSFISSMSCATRSRLAPVCATNTIIRQACRMQRAERSATNATPAERWSSCHLHASGHTKAACVCVRATKHACSCAVQYVRVDARACARARA